MDRDEQIELMILLQQEINDLVQKFELEHGIVDNAELSALANVIADIYARRIRPEYRGYAMSKIIGGVASALHERSHAYDKMQGVFTIQ